MSRWGAEAKCSDSPSGELLQALGEFNRRDWFECHETLEELWIGTEGEIRCFYQGLLQLAVALHHWRNGNFAGAMHLLHGGADYLRQVPPVCQRINVAEIREAADRCREMLGRLGPDRMEFLDQALLPHMHLAILDPGEGQSGD